MNRIVRGGGSGAEVMRSSCQMGCPATDEPGQEWVRRDSAQAADPCACASRGAPAAPDAGAAAEVRAGRLGPMRRRLEAPLLAVRTQAQWCPGPSTEEAHWPLRAADRLFEYGATWLAAPHDNTADDEERACTFECPSIFSTGKNKDP